MRNLPPVSCVVLLAALAARPAAAVPQPPHDQATHGVICQDCHVPYAGVTDPVSASGTSGAGATATSLPDPSKAWAPGAWVGGVITFTTGANAAQFRSITASDATSVTWASPLPAVPATGDGYRIGKTTEEDVETKCRACHNPTGMASASSDVALHKVRGGTTVGCGDCHDPHNLEANSGWSGAGGNDLVRGRPRWPTARVPTAYPSGGPTAFTTGADAFNGICETCHSQTSYHRNSPGGDHTHNATTTCTDCHVHQKGFLGGDCLSCHATAKDNGDGVPAAGRRAVIGEFPSTGAHGHFGATLAGAACSTCHDQASHADGYVDLVDPDDSGVTYRFLAAADLASDPDVSTFCLHCHDADGATRLAVPLDPFGNGNVPTEMASRFAGTLQWEEAFSDWCFGEGGSGRRVNSHHDLSDADQAWSGAKVECLDCHGAHAAEAGRPLVDPGAPTTPWTAATNGFCLACHGGGAGPAAPGFPDGVTGPAIALRGLESCGYGAAPWWVEYTWTHSPHGLDSKRTWAGYPAGPSYEMACTDCHESHGSASPANPAGNPYLIRDFVDGRDYVDDGIRGTPLGPPWGTRGVTREVRVPVSGMRVGWGDAQGLCAACHSEWQNASAFYHSDCDACQNCHGHGQTFGDGYDWGTAPRNDQPCP